MKGLSTVLIVRMPQFIFTSSQPICKETEDTASICLPPHKQLLIVLSMASFDPSVRSLALHPSKPLGDPFLLWPVEEISHMVMGRLHSRANSLGFLFQFSSVFCAPGSWELPGWRTATLGLQGTLFHPCPPIFPSPSWVCTFIFGCSLKSGQSPLAWCSGGSRSSDQVRGIWEFYSAVPPVELFCYYIPKSLCPC